MADSHDEVELFAGKGGKVVKFIKASEKCVYIGVAISLLVISVILLGYTCYNTFRELMISDKVIHTFIVAVQDVLLVMIILEILWTVMSYIESESIPLEPFLFVAIISSVRGLILESTRVLEVGHKDIYAMAVEVGLHAIEIFIFILVLYVLRGSRRYLIELGIKK